MLQWEKTIYSLGASEGNTSWDNLDTFVGSLGAACHTNVVVAAAGGVEIVANGDWDDLVVRAKG
jgi:hypothetical protein